MNIKWPPKETVKYEADNPRADDGLIINAEKGGNPNKKANKQTRSTGEGR